MDIIELILAIGEFLMSWRLYLCLLVSVGAAFMLHEKFPENDWVYFISVPLVVTSIVGSLVWQVRSDNFKKLNR